MESILFVAEVIKHVAVESVVEKWHFSEDDGILGYMPFAVSVKNIHILL